METGGFKGRSRELSKPDLYALFERLLGIPNGARRQRIRHDGIEHAVFYDGTMRIGRRTDFKTVPPWARVLVIDPEHWQGGC